MQTIGDAVEEYGDAACVTAGEFKTEDDAKKAFLDAFCSTDCFTIYPEIDCWYFGGSVFGDRPTGRIDYVLTPRKKLIDAGWRMGVIGVEVKKSGHKAGPLICQMIDYSKAVFRLPEITGASLVCLSVVCCFPHITKAGGGLGSIMANHRIGHATVSKGGATMSVNGTTIFGCTEKNGTYCKPVNCGFKNGSR